MVESRGRQTDSRVVGIKSEWVRAVYPKRQIGKTRTLSVRVVERKEAIKMARRKVSDLGLDGTESALFRGTFSDGKYWLFGQNQVPSVEFTSGKSTCAFLKYCRVANGEQTGTILDMKVLKCVAEVVGFRRRHGCGRAFSFLDCL